MLNSFRRPSPLVRSFCCHRALLGLVERARCQRTVPTLPATAFCLPRSLASKALGGGGGCGGGGLSQFGTLCGMDGAEKRRGTEEARALPLGFMGPHPTRKQINDDKKEATELKEGLFKATQPFL